MYNIVDIKRVHLEISSLCNAACPLCPRNYHGYPYNNGYVERNLTLTEVQQIFSVAFIKQLVRVRINGNYGDMIMNPEAADIVYYLRSANADLYIEISTNGGARAADFWIQLARLKATVVFCLDGLEDTHSLYRQNTLYSTVITNAKTFIAHGGHAIWKFIPFDHNRHQIELARKTSQDLNFAGFVVTDYGRADTPVFNKNKELSHIIGTPNNTIFNPGGGNRFIPIDTQIKTPINCEVLGLNEIFISSEGKLYPCCYIGCSVMDSPNPKYQQIRAIEQENSALEYSMEHCIQWFNRIEDTWNKESFESGRLLTCNDTCGAVQ